MYNEENYDNYEDADEEEQSSGSKLQEIYYNNKKLIWILGIIIVFIIIAALFSGSGNSSNNDNAVVKSVNNPENVQLSKSKQLRIKVRGQEYNGSYSNIKWITQNEKIVSIDSTGMITGKGIGSTIINGVYDEGSNSYTFAIDVNVFNGNENVKLESVDFNDRSLIINSNVHEFFLGDKLNVIPDAGYVYDIAYKSSDPSVVSVDEAGVVKGIKDGHATITASVNNGSKEAIIDVYVRDVLDPELIKIPQKIEFEDGVSFKIGLNESKELKLALSPSDASNKYITWKSSDDSVLNVTQDGMISGVKLGTATVTATALNGKEGKMTVEVVASTTPIDSISIVPSSITMRQGENRQLLPTVKPDSASNKALIFESSNTSIASVVPSATKTSATIYAGSPGTAIITVKSDDGKIATLTVTVNSSSSGGGGGTISSSDGSIKVRINGDNEAPNKTCNGEIKYYAGTATVNVSLVSGDVDHIVYCFTKNCTPNTKQSLPASFTIPSGGTYILRIKKYNSNGKEIQSSGSGNYVNGVLEYYINTKAAGLSCTSRSSWESGGTTTVTTKGACYVNTNSRAVTNSFIWKDAGETMSSYTNLAQTVITSKDNCDKVANNSNGTRNLCFRSGNTYCWGSYCSIKAGYVFVPSITTEQNCVQSSGGNTSEKLKNIKITPSSISLKVGDTKSVSIELDPGSVNDTVTISSNDIFKVSKNSTKTSTTITLTGVKKGTATLTVSGNGITRSIYVDVIDNSSQPTPTSGQTKKTPVLNVSNSVSIETGLCKNVSVSSNVKGRFNVISPNISSVYVDNLTSSFSVMPNESKSVKLCVVGNTTSDNVNVKFNFVPDDQNEYNSTFKECRVVINRKV